MPIDHKRKLIFIHVPKNAGTSILVNCNMKDIGHHKWNYYAEKYPKEWKEYISFAIVRDPIERLISCYEYARMQKSYWHDSNYSTVHPEYKLCFENDINSFLELICKGKIKNLMHDGWSPQINWFSDKGVIKVSKLINYSNLNNELESLGIYNLPFLNKSTKTNKSNISEKYKKIFKTVYLDDYKIFNSLNN